MAMRNRFLPDSVLAYFLPIAYLALTLFLERMLNIACFTACEDGPVENTQALIMFVAFCLGVRLLRLPRGTYPDWARAFFAIGTVGAIYVALEEISYGQRIFGWMTPEMWEMVNDQSETNLHNTSAWLDQKPRLILEIGIIIGGIIIPILRRFKPAWLPSRLSIVFPDSRVMVTAVIAISIHVYDSLTSAFGLQHLFWFDRGSETEETYLFWFIMLYFLFKRRELTGIAHKKTAGL